MSRFWSAASTTMGALTLVLGGGPLLVAPVRAGTPIVVVRPGDTLSRIARLHGTSVHTLVELNHIRDADLIYPGERLRLPAVAPATRAKAAAKASPPAPLIHVVRRGETLTGIARRYRTSIERLVAANHLRNASYIRVGQRLAIPVQPAARAPSPPSEALPASIRARMAARGSVRNLIIAEAKRSGVPPALALAVAWQESGWRQNVTSSAGAIGVMQILPSTADWISASMLGKPVDLRNTRQNILAGVTLLKHYLIRYRGNRRLVLAAYYQGQRSADRHGILPVSRAYVAAILAFEELLP